MPYRQRINMAHSLGSTDQRQLIIELDLLRQELDDIRSKYTALRALLVAGTAVGAGYSTGTGLSAAAFTPT